MNKIKHLQEKYGYRLLAFIESGEAKAAAGFRICESLAWGKYLYVDDLITDEENRSKGYAHRFYLNRKMKITCHHFDKNISLNVKE